MRALASSSTRSEATMVPQIVPLTVTTVARMTPVTVPVSLTIR
jgi:hypothetical protein